MSTNLPVWSTALRAAPGYGARTAAPAPTSAPLNFTMPTLPKVTPLDGEARAPGYTSRQIIGSNLQGLASQYMPQIRAANQYLQGALRGYGGWRFRADDPNTSQDESLEAPTFDPNAGPGVRERQAAMRARGQAAASGMLYSTAAEQNIGLAMQQVSEEARAQVMQYATTVGNILEGWRSQANSYVMQFAQLYGEDSAWLAQNPIMPAPLPDGPAAPPPLPPAQVDPYVQSWRDYAANSPQGVTTTAPPGYQPTGSYFGMGLGGGGTANDIVRVDGKAVTYDSMPNMATIRTRFGANARAVRMGDGRYVIVRG